MKILMTTALLVSIVACSDVEPAKNKTPVDSIGERAVTIRPPLQESEIAAIANFFGRVKLIPDTTLLIVSPDETAQDKKHRKYRRDRLAGQERQLHEQILAKCSFEAPVLKAEGDLKAPESTQTLRSSAKITGDACPIDVAELKTKTTTVTKTNHAQIIEQFKRNRDEQYFKELDQTGHSLTDDHSDLVIKDLNLQKQTGVSFLKTKDSVEFSFDGPSYQIDMNRHAKREVKATLVDGTAVSYTVRVSSLRDKNTSREYIEIDMKFPRTEPIVQIFSEAGKATTYFVNGEATTLQILIQKYGLPLEPSKRHLLNLKSSDI